MAGRRGHDCRDEYDNDRDLDREDDDDSDGNEATDDYSSYWRSIPDPPASNYNEDEEDDDDVGVMTNATTTTTTTTTIASVKFSSPTVGGGMKNHRHQRIAALRDSTNRMRGGAIEDISIPSSSKTTKTNAAGKRPRGSFLLSSEVGGGGVSEGGPIESNVGEDHDDDIPRGMCRGTKNGLDDDDCDENERIDVERALIQSIRRCHPLLRPVEDGSFVDDDVVFEESGRVIEALSGYPMPGRRVRGVDLVNDMSNERDFLSRIRPIVLAMEETRRIENDSVIEFTRCEARKGRIDDGGGVGGAGIGYRYRDVDTGLTVGEDEYRRRYEDMIASTRRGRRRMEHHRRDDMAVDRDRTVDCYYTIDEGGEQGRRRDGGGVKHDTVDDAIEAVEEEAGHDAPGHECDGTRQRDERHDDESTIVDMDESTNMDDSSAMIVYDVVDATMGIGQDEEVRRPSPNEAPSSHVIVRASIDESFGVLVAPPFPFSLVSNRQGMENHRDDGDILLRRTTPVAAGGMTLSTNDPRVLEARRRLWRAIDDALANYSREIMALRG
jgi:hypothetical protein